MPLIQGDEAQLNRLETDEKQFQKPETSGDVFSFKHNCFFYIKVVFVYGELLRKSTKYSYCNYSLSSVYNTVHFDIRGRITRD